MYSVWQEFNRNVIWCWNYSINFYNKILMSDEEEYTVLFSEQDYLQLQKVCENLEKKLKAVEESKKLITGKYDALTEKYENLKE